MVSRLMGAYLPCQRWQAFSTGVWPLTSYPQICICTGIGYESTKLPTYVFDTTMTLLVAPSASYVLECLLTTNSIPPYVPHSSTPSHINTVVTPRVSAMITSSTIPPPREDSSDKNNQLKSLHILWGLSRDHFDVRMNARRRDRLPVAMGRRFV